MPYEYEVIDPILAKHIVDALTYAFGGASQVGDGTIGAAIFGNAKNHGWDRVRVENVIVDWDEVFDEPLPALV